MHSKIIKIKRAVGAFFTDTKRSRKCTAFPDKRYIPLHIRSQAITSRSLSIGTKEKTIRKGARYKSASRSGENKIVKKKESTEVHSNTIRDSGSTKIQALSDTAAGMRKCLKTMRFSTSLPLKYPEKVMIPRVARNERSNPTSKIEAGFKSTMIPRAVKSEVWVSYSLALMGASR
jgi:hypothetical protein